MRPVLLLNWLPFANTSTGAAKRSLELHSRLQGELRMKAIVTGDFPPDTATWADRITAAPERSPILRIREFSPSFWSRFGRFDIFVTDTLPVPRFRGDARVVLTVHDLRFLVKPSYLSLQRFLLLRFFMAGSIRRADALVTVSEFTKAGLTERYGIPASRVTVIPNAPASFPRPSGDPPLDTPYLLSVGHLEPRKDHATLIRAFARIADRWPGKLVVAGRGPDLGKLRTMASGTGYGDRIEFRTRVSDRELSDLYAHCTLLVCQAVYEGFGMTVLEGIRAGVPVLASSIPPHREIAEGLAHWFEPGSIDGLADALSSLLAAGSLERKARSDTADRFSWDYSSRELLKLYRGL